MAKYVKSDIVNRVGVPLKWVKWNSIGMEGDHKTLDQDKSMQLETEVEADPERSKYYEFSCDEDLPGHLRIPQSLFVDYNELARAKIIYIRYFIDTTHGPKLFPDIIPHGAKPVKKLLGNEFGSTLLVGEKLLTPDKNLWSNIAGLGVLGTPKVVKIKYCKHDSRDTRTAYEVYEVVVRNDDSQPPPPSAKECKWEALFGISRGKKFAFFKYPGNHGAQIPTFGPRQLEIDYAPKPRFPLSWRRALLF